MCRPKWKNWTRKEYLLRYPLNFQCIVHKQLSERLVDEFPLRLNPASCHAEKVLHTESLRCRVGESEVIKRHCFPDWKCEGWKLLEAPTRRFGSKPSRQRTSPKPLRPSSGYGTEVSQFGVHL